MTKFTHRLESDRDGARLVLTGVIDEDSELASLADKLEADSLTVNFAGVERITGGGAIVWRAFLDALAEAGVKLVLARCSPAMVTHLNRRGGGAQLAIESFAIPYFCPECDEARTVWGTAADVDVEAATAPLRRCERCDLVMQFDDDPSTYFRFLASEPAAEGAPESAPPISRHMAAGQVHGDDQAEANLGPMTLVAILAAALIVAIIMAVIFSS